MASEERFAGTCKAGPSPAMQSCAQAHVLSDPSAQATPRPGEERSKVESLLPRRLPWDHLPPQTHTHFVPYILAFHYRTTVLETEQSFETSHYYDYF